MTSRTLVTALLSLMVAATKNCKGQIVARKGLFFFKKKKPFYGISVA